MEVASRILVVDGLSITKFRIVAPFGAESTSDSSSSPYTISPLIAEFLDKTLALPAKITQRDLDILQLLTDGMEAKEIAAHLGVTYSVVNRTINRLLRTYTVQNVAQLAVMAYQILKVRKQLE